MIFNMLANQRHEVIVALNGQKSVALAKSFRPDHMLVDLNMSVLDGLAETRIRQIPGFVAVPIIALMASANQEAIELCLAAGCSRRPAKPIRSQDLFRVPNAHLKRRFPTMNYETMITPVIYVILAIAVVWDISSRKIPNALTMPAAAGGLVFHLSTKGVPGLKFSSLGLALGLGIFLVPYILGGIGGGDVKLLAALGAWLGPKSILIVTLYSGLAGGLLALGVIVVSGGKGFNFIRTTYENLVCFITSRERHLVASQEKLSMPYSLAIAVGTLGFVFLGYPPLG